MPTLSVFSRLSIFRAITILEHLCDIIVELALVTFQRQRVVRSTLGDRPSYLLLTTHRVYSYDAAGQFQHPKQLRDSRYLVGLIVHLHLSENQSVGRRPGVDQMNR